MVGPRYIGDKMIKILFVHNTAMWYRIPFFREISKLYDVKFIFTHMDIRRKMYGTNLPDDNELHGIQHVTIQTPNLVTIRLIKELTTSNYDVLVDSFVSPEGWLSFTFAKLRRKPIIFWSEDWGWVRPFTIKKRFVFRLENFILSKSDALLVPGLHHKAYFVSRNVDAERIFIMPNVSNISSEVKPIIRKVVQSSLGKSSDKRIILYVGRLDKRKGVDILVEAFSKLKNDFNDIMLVIVGKGECRNKLEDLARKLDCYKDIQFAGYVEDSYLPAYYDLCDVFVVPSINYGMADPCPLTMNEAMHFGKPVIATNAVGSAFDMIKDGKNGFIIPEKDPNALYCVLKKILLDPQIQKKMGIESRQMTEKNFKYEHMVAAFCSALSKVLV